MKNEMKKEKRYTIGLDFGTLTARAVMVDVDTGEEAVVSVVGYQDAVIDTVLPETGEFLPSGYALQNPEDYMEAVRNLLSDITGNSGVSKEQIIGIGVDATTPTIIPVDKNGMPLCFQRKYRGNKHSWPKLWKHHSAQKQTDWFNSVVKEMNLDILQYCDGKASSEWLFPKVMEILEEAPEIYDATYRFVELADWIVFLLTGVMQRGSVLACLHAQYNGESGFPSKEFFGKLHPRMENIIEEKIGSEVYPAFLPAGTLSEEMATKTGLKSGIAIAVGCSDSLVSALSLGMIQEGVAGLILGTSSVLMLSNKDKIMIPGMLGMAKDALIPGYYGYYFGQAAVGDIFEWFMQNMVPYKYYMEAEQNEVSIFSVMNKEIEKISPGESGLVCLDWLNGSRCVLKNTDVTGVMVGLKLSTTAAQIYRALVEATAFGLKKIIDTVNESGIRIVELHAAGGLAKKNPTIMQIYADILGIQIHVVSSSQTVAVGSAIMGALAAGVANGGYDDVKTASQKMTKMNSQCYEPNMKNHEKYKMIYDKYSKLHDYFGIENQNIMKELNLIRKWRKDI